MGFDQERNTRIYRFEGALKSDYCVTADLALFLEYHVAIQEGPSLCARKLSASPETAQGSATELTGADFRAFCEARDLAISRRVEARKHHPRSNPSERPI
jgi:hypothetical protein